MRLAVFIVVGIVAGLLLARSCRDDSPSPRASSPVSALPTTTAVPRAASAASRGNARVPQRDLDETDHRYDAVLLARENEELSTKEIFEREPRDPAFAPTLEKRISAALATAVRELELEGKVTSIETECKTLSCYTRVEVPREHGQEAYDALNGVLLGEIQEPGIDDSDPTRTYVTVGNLFSASMRDDAMYEKFKEVATRPSLDAAKRRMMDARDEARR